MKKLLLVIPSYLLLIGCSTMDGGVDSTNTGTKMVGTQTTATTTEQKPTYMITHDEDTVGRDSFPKQRVATGKKIIIVDPNVHAWGAYDQQGKLVKTGRASGGRSYCPDIKRGCKTVTGTFTIYRKGGASCKSSVYPLPHGGAPTPYCMHFHKGYALHGSYDVPDYNASHGCVRVLPSAAQWLNEDFATVGTTLVVKPYAS